MEIQKLAIKLALAIKGADLKDCVFTEDGEESSNSTRIPWKIDEISVFRRTMMRKCKLNSEQFFSKISQFKKAINGRSRYEHKKYLDGLGVKWTCHFSQQQAQLLQLLIPTKTRQVF